MDNFTNKSNAKPVSNLAFEDLDFAGFNISEVGTLTADLLKTDALELLNNANKVTLQSSASLATDFVLTFPAVVPGSANVLQTIDTSGTLRAIEMPAGPDNAVQFASADSVRLMKGSAGLTYDGFDFTYTGDGTEKFTVETTGSKLVLDGNAVFTDKRNLGSHVGLVYAADYSVDFVPRSLVDKAYVDDEIDALPGGIDGSIQFNDNLTDFGGNNNFLWTDSNKTLLLKAETGAQNTQEAVIIIDKSISDSNLDFPDTNAAIQLAANSNRRSDIYSDLTASGLTASGKFVYRRSSTAGDRSVTTGMVLGEHQWQGWNGANATPDFKRAATIETICSATPISGSGNTIISEVIFSAGRTETSFDEIMRIGGTGANVGIGTTTPNANAKLDVEGLIHSIGIRIENTSTALAPTFKGSMVSSADYDIVLPPANGAENQILKLDNLLNLQWTEDVDINIYNTSADLEGDRIVSLNAFNLTFVSDADATTLIKNEKGGGADDFSQLEVDSSFAKLTHFNDTTQTVSSSLTLDDNASFFEGLVGIETSTPEALLHIRDGNSSTTSFANGVKSIIESSSDAYLTISGGDTSTTGIAFAKNNQAFHSGMFFNNSDNGELDFRTNNNQIQMTLNSAGQLYMLRAGGDQDFPTNNAVFHAKGTNGSMADIVLDHQSNTGGASSELVMRRMRDDQGTGVPSNNVLGGLNFQAWDGAGATNGVYRSAAIIDSLVSDGPTNAFNTAANVRIRTRPSLADTPINNGFSEVATAASAVGSVVTLDFATPEFQVGDIITTTNGRPSQYNETDRVITSLGTGDQVIYTSDFTPVTNTVLPTATRTKAKIDSIDRVSDVSTVTYLVSHDYDDGDIVTIEDSTFTLDDFNGTFSIFNSTALTFDYNNEGDNESAVTTNALSYYQNQPNIATVFQVGSNGDTTALGDLLSDSDLIYNGKHATNIFPTFVFTPGSTQTAYTQFIGEFSVGDGAVIIDIRDGGSGFGASSQFRVTRDFGEVPLCDGVSGTSQGGSGYEIHYFITSGGGYQLFFKMPSTGSSPVSFTVTTTSQGLRRAQTTMHTDDTNIFICDYGFYTFAGSNPNVRRHGLGTSKPETLFHIKDDSAGGNYNDLDTTETVLLIEDSGDTALMIIGDAASSKSLFFGDGGLLTSTKEGALTFTGNGSSGILQILVNDLEAVRYDAEGNWFTPDNDGFLNFDTTDHTLLLTNANIAPNVIPSYTLRRTRPLNATVIDGDRLGELSFAGSTPSNFTHSARIYAQVNGTPTTSFIPSDIIFEVSRTSELNKKAMHIIHTGEVGIATANPLAELDVHGKIASHQDSATSLNSTFPNPDSAIHVVSTDSSAFYSETIELGIATNSGFVMQRAAGGGQPMAVDDEIGHIQWEAYDINSNSYHMSAVLKAEVSAVPTAGESPANVILGIETTDGGFINVWKTTDQGDFHVEQGFMAGATDFNTDSSTSVDGILSTYRYRPSYNTAANTNFELKNEQMLQVQAALLSEWNFKVLNYGTPAVDLIVECEKITVDSFTEAPSGNVLVTTVLDHPYQNGTECLVSNSSPSGYNGNRTVIQSLNSKQFEINVSHSSDGGGDIQMRIISIQNGGKHNSVSIGRDKGHLFSNDSINWTIWELNS